MAPAFVTTGTAPHAIPSARANPVPVDTEVDELRFSPDQFANDLPAPSREGQGEGGVPEGDARPEVRAGVPDGTVADLRHREDVPAAAHDDRWSPEQLAHEHGSRGIPQGEPGETQACPPQGVKDLPEGKLARNLVRVDLVLGLENREVLKDERGGIVVQKEDSRWPLRTPGFPRISAIRRHPVRDQLKAQELSCPAG